MYLYWRDDQDIIALKASRGKDFLNVVRECLSAYLHGEPYSFPPAWGFVQSYSNETVTLSFSDERDADIIAFLGRQPKGQQSNTIKFILRAYMDGFRDDNYKTRDITEGYIRLKLSTGHDADLLCLYYYNEKLFPQWILQSLRSYVKGEPDVFQVPEDWTPIMGKSIRTKTVTIPFTGKDEEIVRYLNTLKDGLRENAVKNIFRSSFSRPLLCAGMELELLPEQKKRAAKKKQEQKKEQLHGSETRNSNTYTGPASTPAEKQAGKVFPMPSQPYGNEPYGTQALAQNRPDQGYSPSVQAQDFSSTIPSYQAQAPERRQEPFHNPNMQTGMTQERPWPQPMSQARDIAPSSRKWETPPQQPADTEEEFDMDMFDGLGR